MTCDDANDLPVEDGVFAANLDFGAQAFTGEARYVEVRVRPGDSTVAHDILAPRQRLAATPEALHAGAIHWDNVTNKPDGFNDGVDNTGAGTGSVTSVTVGTGLLSPDTTGVITADGTIAVNFETVQARILTSCAVGQYVRAVDDQGIVTCGTAVTGITAGTGLSGGTITSAGTLSIADGGVGLAQINPAQVQSRITGTCPLGQYFRGIAANGTVACEPVPGVPSISVIDGPATFVGQDLSATLGADGFPVMSYYDQNLQALKVAKCNNSACTGATTVTVVDDPPGRDVGRFSSIAIESGTGNPIISYHDSTSAALLFAHCNDPACTSRVITVVDDSTDPGDLIGTQTSIADNTSSSPVISYFFNTPSTGTSGIKLALCSNFSCSTSTKIVIDSSAGSVGPTAIALTGGSPQVLYINSAAGGSAKYVACTNAACGSFSTTTIHSPATNLVTGGVSLRISATSEAIMTFRETNATDAWLKVAHCALSSCTGIVNLNDIDDPNGEIGDFSSIAWGADNLPVMSISHDSNFQVLVAKCSHRTCAGDFELTRLDGTPEIGTYNTILIGADGLPVVAYRQQSSIVKVAKCGTRTCR